MPLGLWESEAVRISRQLAHEGGKVVSPVFQLPFPVLISVRGWVDPRTIVRLEGLN